MTTFIIWYQYYNDKFWENRTIVRHNFSAALDSLEALQNSAKKLPNLYRKIECSFPELLEEEAEDSTYNDGFDKDDFEGYDSYEDC